MKRIFELIKVCFLILLICMGIVAYKGYQRYEEVLAEKPLEQTIAEIQSDPDYTTIEELPDIYLNAVVAVEDQRFYSHYGIDPISIARAILNNIRAGELIEGGSTITQQLAKNLYFEDDSSIVRKAAEAMLTLVLERRYTKSEILEIYVNCIYFGENYYSISEASWGYYGKSPLELSDYEATMLAGVPNAPAVYAPTVNLTLATKRQEKVLESMVRDQYLTQLEADTIRGLAMQMEQNYLNE